MNHKTMKECEVKKMKELFPSLEPCDEDTPSLRKMVEASRHDSCFNKLERKTLAIFNEECVLLVK